MNWDAEELNDIRERLDSTRAHIEEVNQDLQKRIEEGATENLVEVSDVQAILEASEMILGCMDALMSVTMGECRLSVPFAPLKPVIDNGGLKWCCTHDPEHCR